MSNFILLSKIQERYNINKQTLIYRLIKLNIEPITKNGVPGITRENLAKLDHEHLRLGGKLTNSDESQTVLLDFKQDTSPEVRRIKDCENIPEISQNFAIYPEAIIANVNRYFRDNRRLRNNGVLEELVGLGWGLTTSEIKSLTGKKPIGSVWVYDCFIFYKFSKVGKEITWLVKKGTFEEIAEINSKTSNSKVNDVKQLLSSNLLNSLELAAQTERCSLD